MLKKHPDTTILLAMLAWCHWQKIVVGASKQPKQEIAKARQYAERALAVDETFAMAHSVLASLDLMERKHESAIAHADRARELDPNSFNAPDGRVRLYSGQPDQAVAHLRAYMRREPMHQDWVAGILALALTRLGQNDEAQGIYEELLASKTKNAMIRPWALRELSIIAVRKDDLTRARTYTNGH